MKLESYLLDMFRFQELYLNEKKIITVTHSAINANFA